MISHCKDRMGNRPLSMSDSETQARQSLADHMYVLANFRMEHDIPAALGNRAESVSHKASAMLHKWGLRCGKRTSLAKFRRTFFSFCTDLGTELGFGDFRTTGTTLVEELLPDWFLRDVFQSDVGDGATVRVSKSNVLGHGLESDVSQPQQTEPVIEGSAAVCQPQGGGGVPLADAFLDGSQRENWFLPGCVAIPGTLHIVNNALQEVTSKLFCWQAFNEDLKLFEQLWSQGRLQRFVNYCVRGSPLESRAQQVLGKKLGSLYMERWNEVVGFCKRLHSVLPIIKACWNERQYLTGISEYSEEKGQSQFSPKSLTAVLAKPFFFAYLDMVLALDSCIEYIGHWTESCPCHSDLTLGDFLISSTRETYSAKKESKLKNFYNNKTTTCPMRGKMLPELCTLGLSKILGDVCSLGKTELFVSHRHALTQEEWLQILSDFESGKQHAQLEFELKFDWTKRLPWRLSCLACSDDEAMSRRLISASVAEYDSQEEELQLNHHHPLTVHVLAGPLRSQLDLWLGGTALEMLPDLFFLAGCFRFVQITERSFEAAHSIVKRRCPPNASGPLISLFHRLQGFEQDVALDPHILVEVAQCLDDTRNLKVLPILLGISNHPDLLRRDQRQHKNKLVTLLNNIVYRLDLDSQFVDISHLKVQNERDKGLQKSRGEKIANKKKHQPQLRVDYDTIRACALHTHFIELASKFPDALFSLPLRFLQAHEPEQRESNASADPLVQPLQDALTMDTMCGQNQMKLFPDVAQALDYTGPCVEPLGDLRAADVGQFFFKVVNTRPSRRKTMPMPVGAAGVASRLRPDDIAIVQFSKQSAFGSFSTTSDASSCAGWISTSPNQGTM